MFILPELGGMGTGCLFQFTYCDLEKLNHEKETEFETTQCPYISYKYWNRINIDQAVFQPFLFAVAYCGEFVLIICSLFFVHN